MRCNDIDIRLINNPTMSFKYSSERRGHTSFASNKKLETSLVRKAYQKLKEDESQTSCANS